MKKEIIADEYFGQLKWDGNAGCYKTMFEWLPGNSVELWIFMDEKDHGSEIMKYRNIIKTMKSKENEYLDLTAQRLLNVFNDILEDYNEQRVDAKEFLHGISLSHITVNENGESTLTYTHDAGIAPLIVISVSSDSSFKDAVLD